MYLLKWWPMKPLTPRIRTFFKIDPCYETSGERQRLMGQRRRHGIVGQRPAIGGQLQNLKAPSVDTVGVPSSVRCVQTWRLAGVLHGVRVQARLEDGKPTPVDVGKGTGEWRCNGTNQVMYRARAATPVDAPVFRAAAPEIGTL